MIRNQWYAILESREIRKNRILPVKRLGEKMAFWRDNSGKLHGIADKCCHRGASLACGHLVEDRLACPFHALEYDGSGRVVNIPASGRATPVPENFRVPSYVLEEKYGLVWLWWSDRTEDIPEIPFFEDLKAGFTWSTFVDRWPVHYSRAVENQLDATHVPFVHKTTIGAGNRTVVNGPKVTFENGVMTFYTDSLADDGKVKARKPNEIDDYQDWFHLQFIFPNIWQNCISDKLRVFAAFAPVDEENTVVYVRFVQSFMKVPGLRHLINFIGKRFDRIVLRQDKRVVITQIPTKTEWKMNENLIPGDSPILEFRKHRQALKDANNN